MEYPVRIDVINFDFEEQYAASVLEVQRRSADVTRLLNEKKALSVVNAHLERRLEVIQHKDFPMYLWAHVESIPFGKDDRSHWDRLPEKTRQRWEAIARVVGGVTQRGQMVKYA